MKPNNIGGDKMYQVKISAKNLGQVMLEDFCPRCYWIKLKSKNLPWQIFPGIFSSIDAYTKRVTHGIIDGKSRPAWLAEMGDIVAYRKSPHWSKFTADIHEYGITLSGVVDDLLVTKSNGIIIPDYKTAKYTETQDKLLPMYQIQLNGYAVIAEAREISPVTDLYLVYFEPITDEDTAKQYKTGQGFDMAFKAHPVNVAIDRDQLNVAMETTRSIYDMGEPPDPKGDCKDCQALIGIQNILR
jgi:hypothetical protein